MRLLASLAVMILTSCGGEDTATVAGEESLASSTTTTTTTEVPVEANELDDMSATASTDQAVEPANRAFGRTRAGTIDLDGRDTNQFYADDTTLTVVLSQAIGPIEESACYVQFEADTTASNEAIEITIHRLAPAQPAPNAGTPDCTTDDAESEFVVALPEPLDGRPLVRGTDGAEIPVSDVALRRNPTDAPAGWSIGLPSNLGRETVQQLGPVKVRVLSAHTRDQDRLERLMENPNHEVVELADGTEAVLIRRPNGTRRLGFVIDDWFYDLDALAETTDEDLFALADSFEVSDVGAIFRERWETGDTVPVPRDDSDLTFYTRGNTLEAGFLSLDLFIPTDNPCRIQFEPNITETDAVVNVVINSKRGVAPGGCQRDPFVLLPLPLDSPLGNRTLQYQGVAIGTTGIFSRLTPSTVPDEWQVGLDSTTQLRGGTLDFGQVVITIVPRSNSVNIEAFRLGPHQTVDVLDTGDGALLTEADGPQLVFEDSGWVYDIVAEPGLDPTVLLEFARGFQ